MADPQRPPNLLRRILSALLTPFKGGRKGPLAQAIVQKPTVIAAQPRPETDAILEALSQIVGSVENTGGSAAPTVPRAQRLIYDDDPVENQLYGEPIHPATLVTIFEPARELGEKITPPPAPLREPDLRLVVTFFAGGHVLMPDLFNTITDRTKAWLPSYPAPPSPDIPQSTGEVLIGLWNDALDRRNDADALHAGAGLWEWFELKELYAKAREVLEKLITIHERQGSSHIQVAALINNFAFQFRKELRWHEAAIHFDRAAQAYGTSSHYITPRINYWACRVAIERDSIADLALTELLRLEAEAEAAGDSESNGHRTSLIWLARLEGIRGDFARAIEHASKACELDKRKHSRFLAQDEALLGNLRSGNDRGLWETT